MQGIMALVFPNQGFLYMNSELNLEDLLMNDLAKPAF